MPLKRRRQRRKKQLWSGDLPYISYNTLLKPEKQPKDFALQKGANLSERKQNFAKSTLRRKVGNRTFPTGYEAGADLAGHLSERRA
ncbi:MAG TPA: hypothetical protein GX523_03585 [Desulfitobacterium dehalogenans]|uniref:Uncharacterized protein n=1 Tax=Desulfitobacterium dehalogenans TaxID=36854 RepID=A0A7C6Z2T6_9FIRM|nr:hypothetical protein [Desulfitobacterium dehalogenans]